MGEMSVPVDAKSGVVKYPISEIFTSVQGEGKYAGVPMTFIRFSGCSVGKPMTQEESLEQGAKSYQEWCTIHTGQKFVCDTDFRVKERLTVAEILERVPRKVNRVCFTGGEPLIHKLYPVAVALWDRGQRIHLETSGTVQIPDWMRSAYRKVYIAISPKFNVRADALYVADELKFLVSRDSFSLGKVQELANKVKPACHIFVQPVNFENSLNQDNVKFCLELLEANPQWNISIQLHKVLHVR